VGSAEPPSCEGSWPRKRSFPRSNPLAGWLFAAAKIFLKLAQENMLTGYDCCSASACKHYTVEPSFTNARLNNGRFRLSQWKAHIFSLKLTLLKRTPFITDNGHFSVSRVTNSQITSPLCYDTGYLHTLCYFHWHNHVQIVDIVLS